MISRRPWLLAMGIISLFGTTLLAGFEPTTYVFESSEQEKSSTHVLVGTIRAFHLVKATEGPNKLYVAELEVARTEKGDGVQPGDLAYIRFHSTLSKEDLERGTSGWGGCGPPTMKMEPGVGHEARIYALLNDEYHYVADFPASFYRISFKQLKKPKFQIAHQTRTIQTAAFFGLSTVSIGLAVGYVLGGRLSRKRGLNLRTRFSISGKRQELSEI